MEINLKQLHKIPEPDISTGTRPEMASSAFLDRYKPLTILLMDRLLSEYAGDMEKLTTIAESLNISNSDAISAIEWATRIERNSGFSQYQLHALIDDPIFRISHLKQGDYPEKNHFYFRYREDLNTIDNDILSTDKAIYRSGINAWISTYHPAGISNVATDLLEIQHLLEFYRCFSIDLECTIQCAQEIPEIFGMISDRGYDFVVVQVGGRTPLAAEKLASRRYARVELKTRFKNQKKSYKKFHNIMFLLAVSFQLKK